MPATAKTEFDLDQPEGRLAAVEALGHDAYNAAMKAHVKASCVEVVPAPFLHRTTPDQPEHMF